MKKELKRLLRDIELALNGVNNCVVTDKIDAKVDECSWRINNTDLIQRIQKYLKSNVFRNHKNFFKHQRRLR